MCASLVCDNKQTNKKQIHFSARCMKVNTEEEVSKENNITGKLNITKQSKESLVQYFFNKNSEELATRKKPPNFLSQ